MSKWDLDSLVDAYCESSRDEVREAFQRLIQGLQALHSVELRTFSSYPSFYIVDRLVGVQCLRNKVKVHLTSEDANYAYELEELKGCVYPHKGRPEWAYLDVFSQRQVEPVLNVIRRAYDRRLASATKTETSSKETPEMRISTKNETRELVCPSNRLIDLNTCIFNCDKCDFTEQTDARFCGGKGNDFRVMFVSESPSTSFGTGKFPGDKNYSATEADKLFFRVRSKFGLENCYTTDFVKCGIPNGKPTKHKMEECAQYLREEINIVNPQVIVAVGKAFKYEDPNSKETKYENFRELLKKYTNFQKPILFTWHYSYVYRWLKNKLEKMEEYEEQHQKILRCF